MISGILIYEENDYIKNKWFANEIIKKGRENFLDIKLVILQKIILKIEDSELIICEDEKTFKDIKFAINRTRISSISYQLELEGIKVFNNAKVTEICNNKVKTHQFVNSRGIDSVNMILGDRRYSDLRKVTINYPCILKEIDGHGGDEVFKINDFDELEKKVGMLRNKEYLIQEMCENPGIDVRVFVLGREIIGAVLRYSKGSFKSNISLGGSSEKYILNEKEKKKIEKILQVFDFDLVGIDFIFNNKNEFLFNEIEDVVGVRSLYKNYDIDVAKLYVEYIKNKIIDGKL